ncbi:hypothetical protein lerEdw1_008685 [Lerista edwardsae]|nr:hypothetical protein lerEdw1_008685 [Lerista edwardsae]
MMHQKSGLRPKQSQLWILCSLHKRLIKLLIYVACVVTILHVIQNALKRTSLSQLMDPDMCRKHKNGKKSLFRDDSDGHPFLTSRDMFWKNDPALPTKVKEVLRHHPLPFGLNGSVGVAFEALQLIPRQDLPESISRLPCMSCAVVGSSRSLRGRGLGKLIDSHDVVIRLSPTLKKHKEDLGEKTTIRFFRPELAFADPPESYHPDTYFFLVPFYTLDFIWVKSVLQRNETSNGIWLNGPWAWSRNASHLRILNPYINYKATFEHLQLPKKPKKYATTGIIAVNFALSMCHQVSVAGLGFQEFYNSNTPLGFYSLDVVPEQVVSKSNLSSFVHQAQLHRRDALAAEDEEGGAHL